MTEERWERAVPVYGIPVLTRPFIVMGVLVVIALMFSAYRELAGLGPVSGMNDAYGWGIWKTFNIMVMTALGSGAFAVGIAAWVFRRKKLFPLMRMALLTSFLAYACGLMLLGIDAGRPWNFYWILFPWNWNLHSPLAEVAVCMSIYAMIPLAIENLQPVLERYYYLTPRWRPQIEQISKVLHGYAPWIIGLAYILPMMHQSSLGALMLLAGQRVHPLWQTPWLPLLYVWAAAFMAFGCVAGTTMLCCLIWKRPIDKEVLNEAAKITGWLAFSWSALRVLDIIVRGALGTAFAFDRFAGVFWLEMLLVNGGAWMLWRSIKLGSLQSMYNGYVLSSLGGMIYRFSPTTLAFRPNPQALYFPAGIEVFMSLGFILLGVCGFLFAVKKLSILPAPLHLWHDMASYARFNRPDIRLVGDIRVAGAQKSFQTGD
ncbi:MAG TPA: Ni/Fe-hydrogenase cytochrome b subunit [Terriglobales bacterium]|nr:Ni/Fe-hydrogenase cytochrome b subunit [Terriglobales bacterium]